MSAVRLEHRDTETLEHFRNSVAVSGPRHLPPGRGGKTRQEAASPKKSTTRNRTSRSWGRLFLFVEKLVAARSPPWRLAATPPPRRGAKDAVLRNISNKFGHVGACSSHGPCHKPKSHPKGGGRRFCLREGGGGWFTSQRGDEGVWSHGCEYESDPRAGRADEEE